MEQLEQSVTFGDLPFAKLQQVADILGVKNPGRVGGMARNALKLPKQTRRQIATDLRRLARLTDAKARRVQGKAKAYEKGRRDAIWAYAYFLVPEDWPRHSPLFKRKRKAGSLKPRPE